MGIEMENEGLNGQWNEEKRSITVQLIWQKY